MSTKTALITGATSGFGRAIAFKLAQHGYRLIITGRRESRLKKIKEKIESASLTEVHPLCFDIRDKAETLKAIDSLPKAWKKIDVLINNAGLALGKSHLEQGDTEDWDQMLDTNVKGLLYITRAVIPLLKDSANAHIINIGSIAGTEVYPGGNVYCASKHAVNALTKALRIELLPLGIKVSQIRPGLAETEFSLVRYKGEKSKADQVYRGFEPLYAEDIANVAWFVLNTPKHVCINDLEVTPTAQANAYLLEKDNEKV